MTSSCRARTSRVGAVVRVDLAAPERGNALDLAMVAELTEAVGALHDPGVTAGVVLADGPHFCVGGDHEEYAALSRREQAALWAAISALFEAVAGAPVPIVVGVQGRAVGGGLELAVLADLLVVADDARLSVPQVRLGLTVGAGAVQAMTARCGLTQAKRLVLRGERMTGAEAAVCGLADLAVPAVDLEAEVLRLAQELAAFPPGAVRRTRTSLDTAAGGVRELLAEDTRRWSERSV